MLYECFEMCICSEIYHCFKPWKARFEPVSYSKPPPARLANDTLDHVSIIITIKTSKSLASSLLLFFRLLGG